MTTQIQSPGSSSIILSVNIEGTQLDITSASEKEPDALRSELIKALRLIKLSTTDLALIQLQEQFRVSLESRRLKTPDHLAAVSYSCRQGTFDKRLWEAQAWQNGGRHLVDTVYSVINSVSPGTKPPTEIMRTHQLLKVGEQPAITAFHLMNCPTDLEGFMKVKDKFSAYGGVLALTACAIVLSDDSKALALMEKLTAKHWRDLVAHIYCVRSHPTVAGIVQGVFASGKPAQTRRCRLGPGPRKSRTRRGADGEKAEEADTLIEDGRPRKRRRQRYSVQYTNDKDYQRTSSQPSPSAMCEDPNEPAAIEHSLLSDLHATRRTSGCRTFSMRADPAGPCAQDENFGVDLDMIESFLDDNHDSGWYGVDLQDLDLSTPS